MQTRLSSRPAAAACGGRGEATSAVAARTSTPLLPRVGCGCSGRGGAAPALLPQQQQRGLATAAAPLRRRVACIAAAALPPGKQDEAAAAEAAAAAAEAAEAAAAASGRPWPAALVGTPLYGAIELAELALLLMLVDAAFSGDWSRIGAITHDTELALQKVAAFVCAAHLVTAAAAGAIAARGGRSPLLPALKGFLFGALGVYEERYHPRGRV